MFANKTTWSSLPFEIKIFFPVGSWSCSIVSYSVFMCFEVLCDYNMQLVHKTNFVLMQWIEIIWTYTSHYYTFPTKSLMSKMLMGKVKIICSWKVGTWFYWKNERTLLISLQGSWIQMLWGKNVVEHYCELRICDQGYSYQNFGNQCAFSQVLSN